MLFMKRGWFLCWQFNPPGAQNMGMRGSQNPPTPAKRGGRAREEPAVVGVRKDSLNGVWCVALRQSC